MSACAYQPIVSSNTIATPLTRERSRNADQPLACHAIHAIGARMMTAGIFTMHASAAVTVPHTSAAFLPFVRYDANPQTPNTEKQTIGVSDRNVRPKKMADGEIA